MTSNLERSGVMTGRDLGNTDSSNVMILIFHNYFDLHIGHNAAF